MLLARRRVVVTGIGMVTPLGLTAPVTWDALLRGESGLRALDPSVVGTAEGGPNAMLSSRVGGVVRGFEPAAVPGVDARRMARFSQFAVAAASEALANAGLPHSTDGCAGHPYDGDRCGVTIGSGIGSLEDIADAGELLRSRGPGKLSPFFVPRILVKGARNPHGACNGSYNCGNRHRRHHHHLIKSELLSAR